MRLASLMIPPAALSATISPSHVAAFPMDYLRADGLMAKRILPLTQALLIVSAVVVVTITGPVLIAILRRSRGGGVADTPIEEIGGRGWISVGVGLSTVVLVGLVVWTSMTMARIPSPPSKPALSIDVRGHQWWWEFVYQNDDSSKIFTTANEIHIRLESQCALPSMAKTSSTPSGSRVSAARFNSFPGKPT
jgi:cytochrome c oxidase subunit 2